jgi:hypothetical protein
MPIASSGNVITNPAQLAANVVLTGTIKDGEIKNDDISAAAAIAIGKLSGVAASGANNDITSLGGLTTALAVNKGGTGATSAADARTNLGVQEVILGGTGATSAADARTNLGLGNMATQNKNAVDITGGTITGIAPPAFKQGVETKDDSNTTTVTIAHGLGRVPAMVRFSWKNGPNAIAGSQNGSGAYVTGSQGCVFAAGNASGNAVYGSNATYAIYIYENGTPLQTGSVSVDATNITITWTGSNGSFSTKIHWIAQ